MDGWLAHPSRFVRRGPDRATGQRTPRPGALLLAEISCANAISADMVERYSPRLMERIF